MEVDKVHTTAGILDVLHSIAHVLGGLTLLLLLGLISLMMRERKYAREIADIRFKGTQAMIDILHSRLTVLERQAMRDWRGPAARPEPEPVDVRDERSDATEDAAES